MREYALAYFAVGITMLALGLIASKQIQTKLDGWVHAILTCIAVVLFWPALVVYGLAVGWRRARKKAP